MDGLGAQALSNEVCPFGSRVALVEEQVQHGEHGGQTVRQKVGGRHPVRDAGVADLALGPHETLGHRRLGDEEGTGDLGRRQSCERPQCESDLRVHRQRRVTAGEDQAQPVVVDATVVAVVGFTRGRKHSGLLQLGGPGRDPTQSIDRPVAGGRREPRAGIARDAVARPPLDRRGEGILGALLCEVPVAGHPDERGDEAPPLVPERLGDCGLDGGSYISQIGLTSIVPFRAPGILEATSMASSRSLQSTR